MPSPSLRPEPVCVERVVPAPPEAVSTSSPGPSATATSTGRARCRRPPRGAPTGSGRLLRNGTVLAGARRDPQRRDGVRGGPPDRLAKRSPDPRDAAVHGTHLALRARTRRGGTRIRETWDMAPKPCRSLPAQAAGGRAHWESMERTLPPGSRAPAELTPGPIPAPHLRPSDRDRSLPRCACAVAERRPGFAGLWAGGHRAAALEAGAPGPRPVPHSPVASSDVVPSPGAWRPPPGTRPAWNWVPPDHGLTPRLDRVPRWVRAWYRTPSWTASPTPGCGTTAAGTSSRPATSAPIRAPVSHPRFPRPRHPSPA